MSRVIRWKLDCFSWQRNLSYHWARILMTINYGGSYLSFLSQQHSILINIPKFSLPSSFCDCLPEKTTWKVGNGLLSYQDMNHGESSKNRLGILRNRQTFAIAIPHLQDEFQITIRTAWEFFVDWCCVSWDSDENKRLSSHTKHFSHQTTSCRVQSSPSAKHPLCLQLLFNSREKFSSISPPHATFHLAESDFQLAFRETIRK